MAKGIEDLCQRLTLEEDEEEEVHIEKSWVTEGLVSGKESLVGKLLLKRPFNIEGMKTVLSKVWRLRSELSISVIGDYLFLFHFEDEGEKDKVLVHQPWPFNKSLLILQEVNGTLSPENIKFDWCPFWIHVHGLPLAMMSERIGIVIGESIGEVEEVELGDNISIGSGQFRLRVYININKPLKRQKILAVEGGEKVRVRFRYERLPDFCFTCGKLDHQEAECGIFIRMKKDGLAISRMFGPWLRAENMNILWLDERVASSSISNSVTQLQPCSSWWQRQTMRSHMVGAKGMVGSSLNNRQLPAGPVDEEVEDSSTFMSRGRETVTKKVVEIVGGDEAISTQVCTDNILPVAGLGHLEAKSTSSGLNTNIGNGLNLVDGSQALSQDQNLFSVPVDVAFSTGGSDKAKAFYSKEGEG
ncbi:hypothetical protein PTKIN_Ptkin04bG0166900 [Pterospermum kingtungense]